MWLYHCELVLHESLFFATREMGRLYECERYLHNYALTYALGLAVSPYFQASQVPSYAAHLEPLNERGLYVTPARPLEVAYQLATFKYANNAYHVEMVQATRNTPSFGRAKELAVGSRFQFGVLSQGEGLTLPRWLRLGLWSSKAQLTVTEHSLSACTLRDATLAYPLNPLDRPAEGRVRVYDLISMRPTSLLDQVRYSGPGWKSETDADLVLPAGLAYRFPA